MMYNKKCTIVGLYLGWVVIVSRGESKVTENTKQTCSHTPFTSRFHMHKYKAAMLCEGWS